MDVERNWRSVTIGLPTAVGAPIMAFGIFGVAALQHLPGGPLLTVPWTAAVALAWSALALMLLAAAWRSGLAFHTAPLLGSFAIGTWVAATAVVARLLMMAAPGALWLARSLFLMSGVLWLGFLPLALRNLWRLAVRGEGNPSGVILLTTVATQALALIALRLFPDAARLRLVADAGIAFGALAYIAGLVLMLRLYAGARGWRIARDWDNSNCILHGALSITGLAATASGIVAAGDLVALWTAAAIAFVLVEAVEAMRLVARIRAFGWRRGLWAYDTSQWARNFTFGMFYAFTLAFAQRVPLLAAHPVLGVVRAGVAAYGQYVVLLLVLLETLLLLSAAGLTETQGRKAARHAS
jgi:hypothetical protein